MTFPIQIVNLPLVPPCLGTSQTSSKLLSKAGSCLDGSKHAQANARASRTRRRHGSKHPERDMRSAAQGRCRRQGAGWACACARTARCAPGLRRSLLGWAAGVAQTRASSCGAPSAPAGRMCAGQRAVHAGSTHAARPRWVVWVCVRAARRISPGAPRAWVGDALLACPAAACGGRQAHGGRVSGWWVQ